MEHVLTQRQRISLSHNDPSVGIIRAEESLHHRKSLGGRNNGSIGINFQELCHVGGMIRLHMLDNQIIRGSAFQSLGNIIQPRLGKELIYSVHNSDLIIQNSIGIVAHAIGNNILSFEQIDLMVIHAKITNVIGNKHKQDPPYIYFYKLTKILVHGQHQAKSA